jgi:predicted DNA-binding transcriptional regulator YafY
MTKPSADVDRLLRLAIAEKRLISLTYDGYPRVGEPHDYGCRNSKDQLNFFQTAGGSSSGKLDWRTFDVERITRLQVRDEHFAGTRETGSGRHLQWDQLYATVTPRGNR